MGIGSWRTTRQDRHDVRISNFSAFFINSVYVLKNPKPVAILSFPEYIMATISQAQAGNNRWNQYLMRGRRIDGTVGLTIVMKVLI